jgi:hypothetical protein
MTSLHFYVEKVRRHYPEAECKLLYEIDGEYRYYISLSGEPHDHIDHPISKSKKAAWISMYYTITFKKQVLEIYPNAIAVRIDAMRWTIQEGSNCMAALSFVYGHENDAWRLAAHNIIAPNKPLYYGKNIEVTGTGIEVIEN